MRCRIDPAGNRAYDSQGSQVLEDLESHHEMLSRSGGDVLSAGHYDSQPGRIPTGFGNLGQGGDGTAQEGVFPANGGEGNGRADRGDQLYGYGGDTGAESWFHAGYFNRKKVLGQGYMSEAFAEVLRFRI